MNFLGDFYNQLSARLFNIVDTNNIALIKHIDFWNQQYNDDYKEVFGHPAVFLEFKSIPFQSTGQHRQQALMIFDLHIASSTKAKSNYAAQFKDKWLEHLELIDLVNFWLTGWRGDFFSSLNRTAINTDHFYGDVIKHIVSYKCIVKDDSAKRSYTKIVGAKLVVTI